MGKSPERTPQMQIMPPTGKELAKSIQEYYEKYGRSALEENERWRRDSRRAIRDWLTPIGQLPDPH